MWFDSWSDLGRVLGVGTAAYLSLVVVLRVSGKRTLAKLNAFDFVVTVALGSTLATLQLVVAWLGSRVPPLRAQRVTRTDVTQAVRGTGTGAMEDVAAVVLETDGTFSMITTASLGSGTALRDVPNPTETSRQAEGCHDRGDLVG
jgi:uncharacterized membrane protein YcaP (DUF421 family)